MCGGSLYVKPGGTSSGDATTAYANSVFNICQAVTPMLMHFYLLIVTKLPISMSAIYNTDFMSVSIEIEMFTHTL